MRSVLAEGGTLKLSGENEELMLVWRSPHLIIANRLLALFLAVDLRKWASCGVENYPLTLYLLDSDEDLTTHR